MRCCRSIKMTPKAERHFGKDNRVPAASPEGKRRCGIKEGQRSGKRFFRQEKPIEAEFGLTLMVMWIIN